MRTKLLLRCCLPTALVLTAATASAITDLHLDEISVPALDHSTARVAILDAQPTLTKAEKKERKLLGKLVKKLPKPAKKLKDDFKELFSAAKTQQKIGSQGLLMEAAMLDAVARGALALDERQAVVGDYTRLITDFKQQTKVQKQLTKANDARGAADFAVTHQDRAKLFQKAEKFFTKALVLAEKALRKQTTPAPPLRVRSGDSVGQGGALVAYIATGPDDPLAGTTVRLPGGALSQNTVITLEAAADFVTDPDVPAGPAVLIKPATLQLGGAGATLSLPYAIPDGSDPDSVGLFRNLAPGAEGSLDVERSVTFLSGTITRFGTYQAGALAPPEGAPTGLFHVQAVILESEPSASVNDNPVVSFSVVDQDIRFKADGTGQAAGLGNKPTAARAFTSTTPHHTDIASASIAGTFDFLWSLPEPNKFTFVFPFSGSQITIEGVLSQSGRAISYTGRGDGVEIFAVGVKGTQGVPVADLEGRWVATEISMELTNPGGGGLTPFTTPFEAVWSNAFTWFDADASGNLDYDAASAVRNETRITYDTTTATPTHTRSLAIPADDPDRTVTLTAGRLGSPDFKTSGWYDAEEGLMLSSVFDPTARKLTFSIAMRQPAGAANDSFLGTFRSVSLDIATAASGGDTSSYSALPRTATLTAAQGGAINLTVDAGTRAVHTLHSTPPITDLDWTLTPTTEQPAGDVEMFVLQLDGNGNHLDPTSERLLGVNATGTTVLGARRTNNGAQLLGLFVGFADVPE